MCVIVNCETCIVWCFDISPVQYTGGKKVAKSQLYLATDTTPLEQL